jgi:hypothetical protein
MDLTNIIMTITPALLSAGGLLWSFSRQITRIEAELLTLRHLERELSAKCETNRVGRGEVYGVLNNDLKPSISSISERVARLEERAKNRIDSHAVVERLARLEERGLDDG